MHGFLCPTFLPIPIFTQTIGLPLFFSPVLVKEFRIMTCTQFLVQSLCEFHAAVERFNITIFPRTARFNIQCLNTAVGYIRRSTNKQEQSIPDQKKAIEVYMGQKKLKLSTIFPMFFSFMLNFIFCYEFYGAYQFACDLLLSVHLLSCHL